jgi:cytochrome P450
MTETEIRKVRENPPDEEETKTFVARLILNQMANPKSITDREITTHAFGNLTAGSDTTAIAARSAFYYTITNHKVYERLTAEVRQHLQLPVAFTKANELPYLRAVIQEAMRIHPSVGQLLYRTVPEGGASVSGYVIGSGAEVGMSPWVLHRDPAVFPDPDAFIPERWILGEGAQSENQLRAMKRSFFAFGHGTHTCSGKHISIMEVTKLLASLFLLYDIEYVKVGSGYRFMNRWFTSQEGLHIMLKCRR